jgi:DNA-binding MarR family transcriptional regulator/N-acetylglutamate synthase-like GNAT family acetyltransferase
MNETVDKAQVEAVRRFSRFYTRRIGVLHEGYLGSSLSLTQGRVIYEMAQHDTTTAAALGTDLDLDAGYLSRLLKGFEVDGLIERHPSATDGRQSVLTLTAAGRAVFNQINSRSRDEISSMLACLTPSKRRQLVADMTRIERDVEQRPLQSHDIILRPHRAGDMGWIINRHAVIYAEEYGWDITFEALVAKVAAEFIENFKPGREFCWVAENDGAILGSAFVVYVSEAVAKLRLVYVEKDARGTGLGRRLLDEAMSFARNAGYKRMTLWTNDVLIPARRMYETAGFQKTAEESYKGFGQDLVSETWERDL